MIKSIEEKQIWCWSVQLISPVCHPGPHLFDHAPLSGCCHPAACDMWHTIVCSQLNVKYKTKEYITKSLMSAHRIFKRILFTTSSMFAKDWRDTWNKTREIWLGDMCPRWYKVVPWTCRFMHCADNHTHADMQHLLFIVCLNSWVKSSNCVLKGKTGEGRQLNYHMQLILQYRSTNHRVTVTPYGWSTLVYY